MMTQICQICTTHTTPFPEITGLSLHPNEKSKREWEAKKNGIKIDITWENPYNYSNLIFKKLMRSISIFGD